MALTMAACRLTLASALACLLLCSVASGTWLLESDGSSEMASVGSRHLLQDLTPCPHQFEYDNFTIIRSACPDLNNSYALNASMTYPKKQCCAGLADMLCPYLTYIDDRTSACAASFWGILPYEVNYTSQQFFQTICSDPNQPLGVPCPNGTANTGLPATNSSSGSQFSPTGGCGLTSLAVLLAFELLVLIF